MFEIHDQGIAHDVGTKTVLQVITGLERGGAENALYRLLAAQSRPEQFHVVSLTDEGVFGARLRELGIGVTALNMRSGLSSPVALVRLIKMLRRHRPSVVQTWMYHADLMGGVAAKLAGVPVCWGIRHSNLSVTHTKFTTRIVASISALVSRWVPKIIVSCSARAVDVHREYGYVGRFMVIPNGLNLTLLRPEPEEQDAVRNSLGIPKGATVVGHLGRGHPQKDHATLLNAFERLLVTHPSAHLLLAGDGLAHGNAYLDGLLASRRLKGSITALGPRDDVPQLMQAMDVFALSSAFGEAFPNVVAEAMACGVPCVVTDVGDAAEIVGDTGWVVAPESPVGLAQAMSEALAESSAKRAGRGMAARRRIEENYDISRMVAAYAKVWNEVSSKGS